MKLTRKKAIELCIELWTWLAKTGKMKSEWPEWEKYGKIVNNCFFCEITFGCKTCPYYEKFGHCMDGYYDKWDYAETPRTRKKYAKLFLKQIKSI